MNVPIRHLIEAVHDEYPARLLRKTLQSAVKRGDQILFLKPLLLFGRTCRFDGFCQRLRHDPAPLPTCLIDDRIGARCDIGNRADCTG